MSQQWNDKVDVNHLVECMVESAIKTLPKSIQELLNVPCIAYPDEVPCRDVGVQERREPCKAVAMALFRHDLASGFAFFDELKTAAEG